MSQSALPPRPDLEWYKKAAKKLLRELQETDASAQLSDAQLQVARSNGFDSWRKLKSAVDHVTLQLALDTGDQKLLAEVLASNPELAKLKDFVWTHPSSNRLHAPILWNAACRLKNIDMTRTLITAGIDVNDPAVYVDAQPEIMKLLLDSGMGPNAITWPENCTGLMYSAFIDDVENAKLLIDRSADPNIQLDNCGSRALHWLSWKGESKNPDRTCAVAKRLLDAGADVNARTFSGLSDQPITDNGNLYLLEHGQSTILHTACERGMWQLVKLLLSRGADHNLRTSGTLSQKQKDRWIYDKKNPGRTALHLAVEARYEPINEGHLNVVQLLIDAGADINALAEVSSIGVCTPLHLAAYSGKDRTPLIEQLIKAGAEVNVVSSTGSTPLFDAARHHEDEICKLLIAHGAIIDLRSAVAMDDLVNVRSILKNDDIAERSNPIRYALSGAMRDLLVEHGFKPSLHEAAASGWDAMVIQLVREAPQSVNKYNDNGQTPLHLAINEGHQSTVNLLLDRGADINANWIAPGPGWSTQELAERRKISLVK